jgi:glyoxylase-like metal-dependent hydrolase (beta-lactamase superfamily II)
MAPNTLVASISTALVLTVAAAAMPVAAQNFDQVEIGTHRVAGHVYMLTGSGGNIGVSAGKDGVLLIDDQYAQLGGKIAAAVAALSELPIRYLVNTHWHGDHVGGNQYFADRGALIISHQNVRRRMSTDQVIEAFGSKVPAAAPAALPTLTFDGGMSFHFNGDDISILHPGRAHTDGDIIIHFRGANVIHMGDLYFCGTYPFIDAGTGGSIDGMIAAADRVLSLSDSSTKIIPGHGPLSNVEELRQYRQMLATVRDRLDPLISAGRSLDEIQSAEPLKDLDSQWGGGFLNSERFVAIVYSLLSK